MTTDTIFKIRGRISRLIYEKEDFKIYGFCPVNEDLDKVELNKYGNISIKGILPSLIEGKEYELEVEYENTGKYVSYIVKKILTNMSDLNTDDSYNFLSEAVGEYTASNILSVYPNFIKLIIDEKENEIDLNKIKGVKEKRFETIKEKIITDIKFYDIITEFSEYSLTYSQVKLIYEKYTSIEVLREKMKENPYKCLCSLAGIGFKTADIKILNNNSSLATSRFRMKECIMFILKQNEQNGNTWIHRGQLYNECSKLTPQCIKSLKSIVKNDESIYYNEETKRVARKGVYLTEKKVTIQLLEFLKNPNVWDIDIEKYITVDGIKLTEKQQDILRIICNQDIAMLSGFGGTGKSFSTKALTNMLDDNFKSYLLLSPTGKASKVLSNYTGKQAKTIHRGLGYNPAEGFMYNKTNKLRVDVVIVDEFSMVDIFLLNHLLEAIDTNKTKLLFICDSAQIPSVGCGNVAQDIINSKKISTVFLDEVFRYKEGGLSYVATEVRNGKNFLSDISDDKSFQFYGNNKDFLFIKRSERKDIFKTVMMMYRKFIKELNVDMKDICVLSAYNKGSLGTYKINSTIQNYVNPLADREELTYNIDNTAIKFRLKDKVMQTKNNYRAKIDEDFINKDINIDDLETTVFNGDEGEIISIDKNKIIVDFYGVPIKYNKKELNKLLLSYSISMHKSQGSQFSHVILIVPPAHTYFLNRNLLYTAISRAKNFVCLIGDEKTISTILNKSENLSRQTFLCDLLTDLKDDEIVEEEEVSDDIEENKMKNENDIDSF